MAVARVASAVEGPFCRCPAAGIICHRRPGSAATNERARAHRYAYAPIRDATGGGYDILK
jgi:hypothetical protein